MVSTNISPIQTSQFSSKKPVAEAPSSPLLASPFKRKTMSLTQTYYLAHKARAKLSAEAQRPDHDLRKLVGSANLLDALMIELADAEREQESWFNQSVRGATDKKTSSQDRRVQWADTVVEEPEDDWEADDAASDTSDSDSEYEEDEDEDIEMADAVSLARIPSHFTKPTHPDSVTDEDDYFDEEEEEDYAQLSLTRSPSHSATSPPDLDHDSDSSEDESMPSSPPTTTLPSFADKQQEQDRQDETMESPEKAFYSEGYYLPPRNPARVATAISVY